MVAVVPVDGGGGDAVGGHKRTVKTDLFEIELATKPNKTKKLRALTVRFVVCCLKQSTPTRMSVFLAKVYARSIS